MFIRDVSKSLRICINVTVPALQGFHRHLEKWMRGVEDTLGWENEYLYSEKQNNSGTDRDL